MKKDNVDTTWMVRTQMLIGEKGLEKLVHSHVLIVGLGGVGSFAAEMCARAGIGKLTLVDADVVDSSNRNRQIPALSSTVGKLKAEVLAERLRDIYPDVELDVRTEYLEAKAMHTFVAGITPDYAIDAIDTLGPKVQLITHLRDRRIPFVSSMGAGGRMDPTKVRIADISETYNCNLARDVRKKLKRRGVVNRVKVVFSTERVDVSKVIETPDDMRKKSIIGTISYMPAIFGCTLASVAIQDILNRKKSKLQYFKQDVSYPDSETDELGTE